MLPEYELRCTWCHTPCQPRELGPDGVCGECVVSSGIDFVAETLGTGIPAAIIEPPALDVRVPPVDPRKNGRKTKDSDA